MTRSFHNSAIYIGWSSSLPVWLVTLPILSQWLGKGGYNLLQQGAYLHPQFAHMFVSFTRQTHKLSAGIVHPITNWSKHIGLVLYPGFLPLLQIGITEWKHVPYLGYWRQKFFLAQAARSTVRLTTGLPAKSTSVARCTVSN